MIHNWTAEINQHCRGIISELNSLGHFAGFTDVLVVLLQRYNVASFDQLGVGNALSIPSLALLYEINRKVCMTLQCMPSVIFI